MAFYGYCEAKQAYDLKLFYTKVFIEIFYSLQNLFKLDLALGFYEVRAVDTGAVGTRRWTLGWWAADTRAVDTRAVDTRAVDTRVVDTRVVDTRAVDTGAVDTGVVGGGH